ncbi:MAG TPA: DUF1638 domain-containing protein [Anaerolineae bacterium]|nr:DUF1638 domain-containing protein [Anaerolineae bacterium]
MNHSTAYDKPIVILACKVFQHWLEQLLPADQAAHITFFDYGLHAVPKNLRQTIQQAIDNIEPPSLIVLGYGLCGNGLDRINAGKHFLLIPRTDDCIAILLGSYQAYRREIDQEPGTYYLSKGWLEAGTNPLAESRTYEKKYGADTAAFLMDTQYHHYRRLMLVARNTAELETYRAQAQEVAAYCARWGMRYEELLGSDDYLQRLVEMAIKLDQASDDFLLIPPGGTLTQAQFMR